MKFFIAIVFIILANIQYSEAFHTKTFYQKIKEKNPTWMTEQIEADLKPFTTQLSKSHLDELFKTNQNCLFRIRVINGIMHIEKTQIAEIHGAANSIIPFFVDLHQLAPLPDLDILVSGGDGIGCHPNGPALPIFTISKCKEDLGVILIPDWFALKGYEPEVFQVFEGNQKYPWERKRDILFFRGSDSGILDNSRFDAWKQSPRPRLVAISLLNPNLIDAKFALSLHHRQFLDEAMRSGFISNYVPMTDYVSHKYLIDLDGNCASAPRLGLMLHSNCVVFKAVTNSIQWFYKALKPNVHYIPINNDLTDLLDKLQWAKEHTQECLIISDNAQQLAHDILSQESIYTYLYKLLKEYAKRQQLHY